MRVEQVQRYLVEKQKDAFFIESETNRYYISGFTGTSGAILITKQAAFFITDFRYIEQAHKEVEPHGFQIINQQNESIYACVKRLSTEYDIQTVLVEASYMTLLEKEKLEMPNLEIVKSYDAIEMMRLVKTNSEIEKIRRAVDIIEKTFVYICQHIKPGMMEKEVAQMALSHVQKLGGSGMSFETIVASGVRSALPHGVASDKIIEDGDIVTIDFGAYYDHYVSDMTRTFFVGSIQNPKLKEIYNIVKEAKRRAIEAIKPGVKTAEIDRIARDYITERGYGQYFGHGTGHGIGIDIHEAPRVGGTDQTILKAGMIITVEPGIYITDLGGVRIEDDILVTETGYENLMRLDDELIILT